MLDKKSKVSVNFIADIEDMEKVTQLQLKNVIFSRSEMLRKIMKAGLQAMEEKEAVS